MKILEWVVKFFCIMLVGVLISLNPQNQRKILMVKNLWCSLEILPEDIVLQNFTFLNGKKLAKKLKY
ncbi:MAG: hypothetical protein IIU65_01845 [Clostridia bacterium]|nr:hypothetical protein [Clostridia bacterium]